LTRCYARLNFLFSQFIYEPKPLAVVSFEQDGEEAWEPVNETIIFLSNTLKMYQIQVVTIGTSLFYNRKYNAYERDPDWQTSEMPVPVQEAAAPPGAATIHQTQSIRKAPDDQTSFASLTQSERWAKSRNGIATGVAAANIELIWAAAAAKQTERCKSLSAMERSDGAAARREFLTKKRRRTATNDAYLRMVEMRAAAEMGVNEETKAAKR
jgi:hypothetical protein